MEGFYFELIAVGFEKGGNKTGIKGYGEKDTYSIDTKGLFILLMYM